MPQSPGYWLLTAQLTEPTLVKPHWMDEEDLERMGIQGVIGEEYQLDEDDPESKHRIVGQITGKAAKVLHSVVEMIEAVEGGTTASQEFRYNIMDELVRAVVNAVKRSQKKY